MTTAMAFERAFDAQPELARQLWPKWSRYIPIEPTAKELLFLCMNDWREVFFGGAAGGGKSEALLAAALQYVDVPGYSALIVRRSYKELTKGGALIDRAHAWLDGTDARWSEQNKTWYFPTAGVPAQLAFGYLDHEADYMQFQSAEYQYVALDEATHQPYEESYEYLGTRLRRLVCSAHKLDEYGAPQYVDGCNECAVRRIVPIRLRAASNPGGPGHYWVKERFQIKRREVGLTYWDRVPKLIRDQLNLEEETCVYQGTDPSRPHILAFAWDNPYLDVLQYVTSLQQLGDKVTRAQLLRGNWGVSADSRFKREWIRYWHWSGDYVVTEYKGKDHKSYHKRYCRVFMVVDPAASAKEGPGDRDIWRRAPSWTVIGTFIVTPDGDLLWWRHNRSRKEIPDVIAEIKAEFVAATKLGMQPEFVGIEADGLGIGVYQTIQRTGLSTRDLHSRSRDKLVRATDANNRMEQGKVYLLSAAPWLDACEGELFTWTGHPVEPADQIDVLAHAAMIVSVDAAMSGVMTVADLPSVERW